ncbi:MAG: hypothetical protein JWO59_2316 [Chloroflexi bacterium]|nr:hypothetical protein [Chloroflexota bacterium]
MLRTLRRQVTRTTIVLLVAVYAVITGVTHPSPAAAAPAHGDIPDSATYLTLTAPHYKVQYIEGWGRQTAGSAITFSDKDSFERVMLQATPRGSLAAFVRGPEMTGLRRAHATKISSPRAVSLPGGRGWYLQYTIPSAADPVTGKVVSLLTDRYYLTGPHQLAVLTLASPVGDDNVDAYRRIAHSFGWR